MRKWILVDYDSRGFCEIQANDEHPQRDKFDDQDAVAAARRQAKRGDKAAAEAVAIHDRDGPEVAKVRSRLYGGTWQTF